MGESYDRHDHEHHHECCGHEHGESDHEHHHDCCGHEHGTAVQEELHGSDLHIHTHVHDGAAVVSAKFHLQASAQKTGDLLKAGMETLGQTIVKENGIIGHIKSTVEIHKVEMYSLTDEKVDKRESTLPELDIHIVAIVFMDECRLEGLLKQVCEDLIRDVVII